MRPLMKNVKEPEPPDKGIKVNRGGFRKKKEPTYMFVSECFPVENWKCNVCGGMVQKGMGFKNISCKCIK